MYAIRSYYDRPLDHILQLPDIAGPRIFKKVLFGDLRNRLYVLAKLAVEVLRLAIKLNLHLSDLRRVRLGLLAHAHSMLAFTNPSTNSYKRLVPGFEAPIRITSYNVCYTKLLRSARLPSWAQARYSRVVARRPPPRKPTVPAPVKPPPRPPVPAMAVPAR